MATEYIDYYKTLGVAKDASADDIKKAYRKLARKLHPDVNPNDPKAQLKFQQLNTANEVLSDPEKRRKFDKYGKDWEHGDEIERMQKQQRAAQQGGARFGGNAFEGEDLSDFFGSIFGGGGRRGPSKTRGQDLHADVALSLQEAAVTQQRTFNVNGSNIRITVAAGIEDGQTIKLKGHGHPGSNGGPNGDLFVKFSVANSAQFTRLGNDLQTNVSIDLYTAVLGGDIMVETLSGKQLKLKVAAGAQNGTKMRLKGQGFPIYKKEGEFGDLYIVLQVQIPTALSDAQRDLFAQLAALG